VLATVMATVGIHAAPVELRASAGIQRSTKCKTENRMVLDRTFVVSPSVGCRGIQ